MNEIKTLGGLIKAMKTLDKYQENKLIQLHLKEKVTGYVHVVNNMSYY
ncbi:hypothetical protein M4L39_04120 [Staphylococcus equorum]|uniref:Uncharacterized protein n=1 Tax=Staphylococcus equorum TaxID=246432 RepID=A0A9X4QZZ2_9STAP|nr:hypothetical protein [Staphylococcus equorum]MDG0842617.1 hypothetical protein [Staphylococcus equorum]MDG0858252.1 hypothetical protein [Staphylococcus equorum]